MIDSNPINTYEVVVSEGSELGIVRGFSEEGVITNHGTIGIADGVTINHAGYGFTNTGTIMNEGTVNVEFDTIVNSGTITNNGTINASEFSSVENSGVLDGRGFWNAEVSGEGTIEGEIFSCDVSSMIGEDNSVYDYAGFDVVVTNTYAPEMVIAGIPFATVEDALGLINVAGDFATYNGTVITFIANVPDTQDVTMAIPEGSDVTIDLAGHDVVLGEITVNGSLTVNDSVGEGSLVTFHMVINGGVLDGNATIVGSSGADLIDVTTSGTVSGLTIDITALTGGAISDYLPVRESIIERFGDNSEGSLLIQQWKGRGCPLNPWNVNDIVKRLGRRHGVVLTSHSLRRLFATTLYDSGVDQDTLRRMMRHSNIQTTMQCYLEADPRRMKDASDRIDDAFLS